MTIQGYKGFAPDLTCRSMQYTIGGTYETDAKPIRCTENGFHLCEFPFDVWSYYPPNDSRYCAVIGEEEIDRTNANDSKVAVSKLHIGAEIGLNGLINAGVKFILARVKWEEAKESQSESRSTATNTGDWSAATNTGRQSAATNTGRQSAASVAGAESVAMAIGYQSRAKGELGCWLVLAEWDTDAKHIHEVQVVQVDGKRIHPDTWYRLTNGQFVEARETE